MPDQSSAATEHAIIQEISAPLEGLPDEPLATMAADFPAALRGYDRVAVDEYVERTSQLVAELQATRSPEAAVRRALERVGEQVSGILQRAHETAEQITSQSRAEAEDRLQQARAEAEERLEQARAEAAEIVSAAEQRVRDVDADADRIWSERERIVADAEDLAGQLRALAQDAAGRFPADGEADGGRAPSAEDADLVEPEDAAGWSEDDEPDPDVGRTVPFTALAPDEDDTAAPADADEPEEPASDSAQEPADERGRSTPPNAGDE